MLFRIKIYDKLLKWKNSSSGSTALIIEEARRVGKSTVAETFAKNEYEFHHIKNVIIYETSGELHALLLYFL